MKVYRAKAGEDRLWLEITTDLGVMTLPVEQKRYEELGLLFVGPNMESVLPPIRVPENLRTGREAKTLLGFTGDPQIIALWEKFQAKEI